MTTLSAEEIANNKDLLTEILLRLRVKPLFRSKCVSKQWLSLISDPRFCLSHNRQHHTPYPTPTAILLNNIYTETLEFKILPLKHEDTVRKFPCPRIDILQSCNALLLCTSPSYPYSHRYFICNPITKQFKKLPFPNPEVQDSAVNLSLAFDPLKSIHYKIIAFLPVQNQGQVNRHYQCQIYIYSSETDSWSPMEIIYTPPVRRGLHFVFCNGAIHWIHWNSWDTTFLYFDVDRECLNTMPMPNDRYYQMIRYYQKIRYFGESCGHLHLIVKDTDRDFIVEFDVLEMAMDYSGWFVRYHVNLDALRIMCPKLFWHGKEDLRNVLSIWCVIQAEKEEESMVVVFLNGCVISYNVSDGTPEELFHLESKSEVGQGYIGFVYRGYLAYQYFETLSCV